MATDFIERIPKETQTMAHRPGMRSVARTPSPLLFPLSRTGLSVLMAAGLAAGGALPRAALAQAGAAAASAAQRPFQVPAGPLAAALTAFAADAGISISAPPALVQGRRTQGVQGRLTVREALDRLLAGTDLQAQAAGEGGFVLRVVPEATQASMVLGEVKVTATAQAESPWGSTSGYVARRASTATKTDASILEVAQSVSVITRDRMDDQGVRTRIGAVQATAHAAGHAGLFRHGALRGRAHGGPEGAGLGALWPEFAGRHREFRVQTAFGRCGTQHGTVRWQPCAPAGGLRPRGSGG
jgi:iron complex outermembrane receptor protein